MIDHHEYVCHRHNAARATGDRYAPERGYDFSAVPAEPRVPGSVKVVMAVIAVAAVLAMVAPSIARVWL